MKTFQFVHFSTFYSISNFFDRIDINWYRLLNEMSNSWTSPSTTHTNKTFWNYVISNNITQHIFNIFQRRIHMKPIMSKQINYYWTGLIIPCFKGSIEKSEIPCRRAVTQRMGHVAAVTVQTMHHRMRRSRISARVFEMQQSIASVILFEKKKMSLWEKLRKIQPTVWKTWIRDRRRKLQPPWWSVLYPKMLLNCNIQHETGKCPSAPRYWRNLRVFHRGERRPVINH